MFGLTDIAYAMGQTGGQGGSGGFGAFVPLILMFVIFYFLLIRPQQKKNKDHRMMIQNLKKGDQIVTNGGLLGRITGLSDTDLTVEIAHKVRVKVRRSHVSALATSAPQSAEPKKDKAPEDKDKKETS